MGLIRPFSVGLDLDGVSCDYENGFRRRLAQHFDVPLERIGPQTSWSFTDSGWVSSPEEFLVHHRKAVSEGMFAELDPIPGVVDAMWRLHRAGIHIRVITHRLTRGMHARAAADTVTWLDRVNLPYDDLCFVYDKPLVGADVYVDDGPHNIVALREAGAYAICFDQRYNRDLDGPRAHNWDEAEEMILTRKAELGR